VDVPLGGDISPVTIDAAAAAGSREASTIEERVPVLDEVTYSGQERIEHVLIPLQPGKPDAPDAVDEVLELVEPEAQHSPTEEDVDSLLAATAGALLSANMKPEPTELEDIQLARAPQVEESEQFEVLSDDGEQVQEMEFDDESVDLTAALDAMPAAAWCPSQGDALTRGEDEETGRRVHEEPPSSSFPDAQPIASATLEPAVARLPEETFATQPEEIMAASSASAAFRVDESRAPIEQEAFVPSGRVSEMPALPVMKSVDEAQSAQHEIQRSEAESPEPEAELERDHSILPEITVENPVPVSAAETLPLAAGVARIAAAAPAAHHASVVTPIARGTARPDRAAAAARVDDESVIRILRDAVERGATTVYVVAQSKPLLRVDGEISALDDYHVLADADIGRLVSALQPHSAAGFSAQAAPEWISEVPQVGRVRCVTFRDHRGPGIIFRLTPPRSISAEHLNLSPEIRELATLSDGFVLLTGARGSGKSTLLNSFVDLINRSRGDHVITIEAAIGFVHDNRRSFVSQREVGDDGAAVAAALGSALREDPDVLVIDDLKSGDAVKAALQAAESGRLVFASITAASSPAALEALVNLLPVAERAAIRASLSAVLRGIVGQVLLRRSSGGHVAARELLLNSPAASASIQQGEPSGFAAALEKASRPGVLRLNDSLAALVKDGTVHGAEAYRLAPDRPGLVSTLARDGIDTSFVERLGVS
jgi:twitching motility protein PilT